MLNLNEKEKLKKIEAYACLNLEKDVTGHGMDHIYRVVHFAREIAETEDCNVFTILAAAFLHDCIDDKVVSDKAEKTIELIDFLNKLHLEKAEVTEIIEIIEAVSYSQQLFQRELRLSKEAQIVQDADRLDAMGTMGIIRAVYYGGARGHKIYDPSIQPMDAFQSKKAYREGTTVINHFYEKLLKLPEILHTKKAKELSIEKQQLMEAFLNQFFLDWKDSFSFE